MLTKTAIEFFKTKAELARAAGVSPPAIHRWGERVPELRAIRLHKATKGKLKYSPKDYE